LSEKSSRSLEEKLESITVRQRKEGILEEDTTEEETIFQEEEAEEEK
jgi:hypothetical protein